METRLGQMNSERFLIDTNIFILLFNNRLTDPLPDGKIACSVITEMELLSSPAMTSPEEVLIREMLADITIYSIDQDVKEKAIRVRRKSRLKLPDAIIAATAICHHAVLVTNDNALQNVPDLKSRRLAVR
ncbi:MAG: type II toxin-antitoxin system VapC family toxin [Nitrospira sp.]|nr:type II toxin-antitoxin system VapC family toxin [Nitrospira sp.]